MKKRHLVVLLLLGLFICFSSSSWAYIISRGPTGGDCSLIGTWDAKTATCTLNTDITLSNNNYTRSNGWLVQLMIDDSGITLDGNGHKITDPTSGPQSVGVSIDGGRNINITNITIEGYNRGLFLSTVGSLTTISDNATNSNINITNNIIRYNREGIAGTIENSNISTNIINSNHGWGLFLESYKSVIAGNTISNNGYGINVNGRYHASFRFSGVEAENTIINNVISVNRSAGLQLIAGANNTVSENTFFFNSNFQLLSNSSDINRPNKVYNNNFIANKNIVIIGGSNVFNSELPVGGNYWSDFDTPEEGCSDSNEDGICDMSKIIINSFFDNFPWTAQNGWPVSSGGSTGGGTKGGGGRR